MGYEYELTLENGEAVELPPLAGNTNMARSQIHNQVYRLAKAHEADGGCTEHRGLSIRSVNRSGRTASGHHRILTNYRIRFQCGRPNGSVVHRAGTAKLVNPEEADADHEQRLTRLAEQAAEVYANMTAARSAA